MVGKFVLMTLVLSVCAGCVTVKFPATKYCNVTIDSYSPHHLTFELNKRYEVGKVWGFSDWTKYYKRSLKSQYGTDLLELQDDMVAAVVKRNRELGKDDFDGLSRYSVGIFENTGKIKSVPAREVSMAPEDAKEMEGFLKRDAECEKSGGIPGKLLYKKEPTVGDYMCFSKKEAQYVGCNE
jgi:hypothetical protein